MGGYRLEAFKFGIYLLAPVGAVALWQDPDFYRAYIQKNRYVVYPKENPERPEDYLNKVEGIRTRDNWADFDIDAGFDDDNSGSGETKSSGGTAEAAPTRWRRYIFFGPRDDPEALRLKRAARASESS